MKTHKNNKKIISLYLKQLKSTLVCSASMKKALINEIKHKIAELENQIPALSVEDLHTEIGSPDEIAKGFESRDDIEALKKKANGYTRIKIICVICTILALILIVTSIIIIHENDTYHSETDSKSSINLIK